MTERVAARLRVDAKRRSSKPAATWRSDARGRTPASSSSRWAEELAHAGLCLDFAEVNRSAGARRVGGVHLLEHGAGVAHLLLRLEEADEDRGALSFVDKQLESGGVNPRR